MATPTPDTPEHPDPRAALLQLIADLPDEAVLRLWRFLCWWMTPPPS